jgi:hypothetical protein
MTTLLDTRTPASPSDAGLTDICREAARLRASRRWAVSGNREGRAPRRCGHHRDGCPTAPAGFAWYVSVRAGMVVVVLAGPYSTHLDAVERLEAVAAMFTGPGPRRRRSRLSTATAPIGYEPFFGPV